jgi:N-succinyldiaminopimelate aminotransferase
MPAAPDDAAAGHPAFRGPTSSFAVMTAAAQRHAAVNLGQGFPDADGPATLKRAAADHLLTEPQQYAPVHGLPLLRSALAVAAATDARVAVDPDAGVVVTAGATEALAAALLGIVRPGDEVVIIDPCYDSYAPLVRAAGGACVPLALDPAKGWALPAAASVKAAFSKRTRALVLNTPHNPTGKVFTESELAVLADAVTTAGAPGCVVIADEVYEYLTFPGTRHVSIATLPGMADRCVRIGSAGKTFSMTGWKVGWALSSSPALLAAVLRAHQFLTFSVVGLICCLG